MKRTLLSSIQNRSRKNLALYFVVGAVVAISLWGSGSRVCAPQGTLESLFGLIAPQSAAAYDGAGMKGQQAPTWTLETVDGKSVNWEEFKGKVVLVDFWATWCPPCVRGVPDLIELQKAHGDKGLAIIGVSLDDSSTPVKKFLKDKSVNYTVVMGNEEITEKFGGIEAIPTAFLIDRLGKIVWQHRGLANKADIEKQIAELL